MESRQNRHVHETAPIRPATLDGRLTAVTARFRDRALEREFQRANRHNTRQYLLMLASVGIAAALLTAYAAWITLPPGTALTFGTVIRVVLIAVAGVVMIIARRSREPSYLLAGNAVVLALGLAAMALRMSIPPPEPLGFNTVFHVTRDGVSLMLVVAMAELILVPGWFVTNAMICTLALVLFNLIAHTAPDAPYNAVNLSYASVIGFLFILAMGFSAQRLRRSSFFANELLRVANRRLNQLATLDHLTGCANRRHFYDLAEAELARSRRYERAMSLVILDVDRFKSVNDEFGHAAGDEVLTRLSEALREELRELDAMGRIGGEEFALLLPETGRKEAVSIAQRLRRLIDELSVHYEGNALSVTASFGVASRVEGDTGVDSLMRRADHALYEAKAAGRNCVALCDPERTATVVGG